jgi:hypothetical protein
MIVVGAIPGHGHFQCQRLYHLSLLHNWFCVLYLILCGGYICTLHRSSAAIWSSALSFFSLLAQGVFELGGILYVHIGLELTWILRLDWR